MYRLISFSFVLFLTVPSLAADKAPSTDQAVRQQLKALLPGVSIDSVRPAPIEGFYEVVVGSQVMYLRNDGKYLFVGDLVETSAKSNLTKKRRGELTAAKLSRIDKNKMIVIGTQNPKRYVTVFTDVDCPYCSKFHRDVPELNAAGVEVRYLLFPRTGVGSRSYFRAVSVWCAKDKVKAVGVAKAGGEVELQNCDNPVQEHMELGAEVGVEGTPAIVLDTGEMIPGYVPPKQLLSYLGISSKP